MINTLPGLNICTTNALKWLEKYRDFNSISQCRRALFASLDRELHQSLLEISVFGFEVSNLKAFKGPVDCSILLEPNRNFLDENIKSKIDNLFFKLYRLQLITSMWLEFDYPYTSAPLIYFSLSEHLSNRQNSRELKEFIDVLFSPDSSLLLNIWSEYSYPDCDDIISWLDALPACSIQQFGLSFRNKIVQPRILSSLEGLSDALLASTNIFEILIHPPDHNQYLFAFAWPYLFNQVFGCEIIADLCATCGLRQLRQPPRLMGSNLDRSIKNLLDYEGINNNSRNIMRRDFRALEHRVYQAADQVGESDTEVVEISGWNHLKLIFKGSNLTRSKLYGGTVRNRFLQKKSPAY